jgi:glycosyltransferase involved in cell wall biosynthesis
MKKLKVCMMARVTTAHSRGGMEIHTKIVCEELAKLGVDIHLIAPSYDGKEHNLVENGINIHYVTASQPRFLWSPQWSKGAYEKFIELDKKFRFDVFHSMASGGIPFLIHILFKKSAIKKILTLHGTPIDEIKSFVSVFKGNKSSRNFLRIIFSLIFHSLTHPILFILYRNCDVIIATSKPQIKNIKKTLMINSKKIVLIQNGINTDLFSPKNRDGKLEEKLRKNSREKILFWVGRMDKQKGIQVAINGMKYILSEFPETKLYIMGDKEGYYKEIKKMIIELSLSKNIIFLDSVSYEQLPKYINICNIYVHPTLRDEAAPLVIPQAIACGKPVVASNIGGIPDVILNGVNGYVFEPGNAIQFSNYVNKIISDDKLSNLMGHSARKIAIKNFSSVVMTKKLLEVYKNKYNNFKK